MKNINTLPKLLLVFGVNFLLFMILLVIIYNGFRTMVQARDDVLEANQLFEMTNGLQVDLLQLRAGLRDLAIDEIEPSTEPLKADAANLQDDLEALKALHVGNSSLQLNSETLHTLYRQWLSEIGPALTSQAEGGMTTNELHGFILADPGEDLFKAMQDTLQRIRVEEQGNLNQYTEEMRRLQSYTSISLAGGGALIILVGMLLSTLIALSITRPLSRLTAYARRIATGDYSFPLEIDQKDEVGRLASEMKTFQKSLIEKTRVTEAIASGDLSPNLVLAGEKDTLGKSINRMISALRKAREESRRTDWIKSGLNELALQSTGERNPATLARNVLDFITPYLNAQVATLYLLEGKETLKLYASYALDPDTVPKDGISVGQGIVGQAAREKRIISIDAIPDDYLTISSSLGRSVPRSILTVPFVHQNSVIGVIEIGAFEPFPEYMVNFLKAVSESLGVAFDSLNKQAQVRELLERTQKQASQLQEQQEELKAANEELEEHTQTLQQSEEELKQQREELQTINEELEEKNEALEKQKALIEEQNQDLEKAWEDIRRKAAELEISGQYKSEFLANMSHELRTPLNSLLLLARSLRDNAEGNLSPEDIEAAEIIYKNGTDLLNLINDILDLSKIEAGKMSIQHNEVSLSEVSESVMMDFRLQAEEKGLLLEIDLDDNLPSTIQTDRQRLDQVLRNLISNAVKFTSRGGITLRIQRPETIPDQDVTGLEPGTTVAFKVEDTGEGIPADKQQEIFEAFQQGDGSTSRHYGGTGLGLTISRQLARLLGGEITIESVPGQGSAFTLFLPVSGGIQKAAMREHLQPETQTKRVESHAKDPVPEEKKDTPVSAPTIPDDREDIRDNDRVILIIEDDLSFAKILLALCHKKGFKAVVASTGEEGLVLTDRLLPTGIILDLGLPGISGWTVLNTLKRHHRTQHIPVHVVSVHETPHDALVMGAIGFLNKPVVREDLEKAFEQIESAADKKVKDLLLVEDDADLRLGIQKLLQELDVNVTEAATGKQALQAIREKRFDCMVLDLGLADMSGFDLLKRLEKNPGTVVPPVIVYTGKELTREEERELRTYAESIIIKGARSEERLLNEATLFLHRMVSKLPWDKQRMIINLHKRDAALEGKKVLLVDDDMRNLFALSRVLTEKGLRVIKAEDGAAALDILDKNPDVDIVFMDIMMPGMDGYEAMQHIRSQPRFSKLPVVALTAKAMKEDREKCIEAGASDYLSKPVDIDKMLSMIRVWLYRS